MNGLAVSLILLKEYTIQLAQYHKSGIFSPRSVAFSLLFLFAVTLGGASYAEEISEGSVSSESLASGQDDEVIQTGLWPLLVWESAASWERSAFRPFYVEWETTDGLEKKVHFLWPIYSHRRSDEDLSIRIVPVYTYWKNVYSYEDSHEYETQYMLFPFVFGGTSTEEDGYFAVFPIGGNIKHFLGRDDIRFVLFPLYMEYDKDELRQRNYLWPVLSFSDGGNYSGFRVWPLYGRLEKKGEYRRMFALWPFYHYHEFNLDKEQSAERLFVLPFYAKEDSSRRRYRSVLWPFFSWEENYARNFEERSTPWPFIVIARGDFHRTQYWPFYGFRKSSDIESRFILWPFWQRRFYEMERNLTRSETWLLPFWFSKTERGEAGEVITHKTRCWPLYRFRRFEDDATHFRMFSLLWFEDESGFELQYSPLWTIYEQESRPDGTGYVYALWRLYRREYTETGTETRIPFVFSSKHEEKFQETTVFGGLVGTKREEEKRMLRLLYFWEIPY